MAVVAIVNNLNARDRILGHLLRCLYFYAAHFQFVFSAMHIPGIQNIAADALSRGNLSLFRSLFPQAPEWVVPFPPVNPFLQQPPDWNPPTWMALFRASLWPVSLPPLRLHTDLGSHAF